MVEVMVHCGAVALRVLREPASTTATVRITHEGYLLWTGTVLFAVYTTTGHAEATSRATPAVLGAARRALRVWCLTRRHPAQSTLAIEEAPPTNPLVRACDDPRRFIIRPGAPPRATLKL